MTIRTILSAVALTVVAVGSSATAQTYGLGYDQTRYDTTGESVEVTLFLTEDVSDGSTSRLATANPNDDLFSFSVSVDYGSFTGGSGSTFSSLEFASGFVQSSDAVFTRIQDSGTRVSFESTVGLGDGLPGTLVGADLYEIPLATLVFDAGDFGSVTTLQSGLTELVGNEDLLFEDNATPELTNFGTAQIFVAVPEPGSAAFIALLAGAGMIKRRRK